MICPVERHRAAVLAGHSGDTATARSLLDDEDPRVRAGALGALERCHALDDATLRAALTDPLVREAAVAALGSLGDERGLDAILHACADRATVRRRAVLALAPFDTPAVRVALAAARHDRDWQVRQSAEDLALIMGLDDEP